MYIVAAEKGQKIHIGNEIYLVIMRIHQTKGIEIGIEAPPGVFIHREEFLKALLLFQKKFSMQSLS